MEKQSTLCTTQMRFWPGGGTPPPDAQHPAKSGDHPQGNACIPKGMAPDFIGPEAHYISYPPCQPAETIELSVSFLSFFHVCDMLGPEKRKLAEAEKWN
jgi:hypothetical protein